MPHDMSFEDLIVFHDGDIDQAFEDYDLYQNRRIYLGGEVNARNADDIIQRLRLLDTLDPYSPIEFVIDSGGGSVSQGLEIITTMDEISAPVHTICPTGVQSMAATIFAAGDHRTVTENCQFMIHFASFGPRHVTMNASQTNFSDNNNWLAIQSMMATTGLSQEVLEDIMAQDVFYIGEEIVALGFADELRPRQTEPRVAALPHGIPENLLPENRILERRVEGHHPNVTPFTPTPAN
jgi:ATP-dependent Clp protease protease subunit